MNIRAFLGLDTAGFKAGLASSQSSLNSFVSKAAGLLGVSISVAGIEHLTKSVIEGGARVYDLGKRYNVSTDSVQKFGRAAELTGGSAEGVAKGFNKLDISISRALGGNEKVTKSFKALGITLDDLRSMSPEEIMLKLGKSSMNAADLVTLLGKSALELKPTLQGLADGTIELGDAIDKHLIAQLKEADDVMKKFGQFIKVGNARNVQYWFLDTALAAKSVSHAVAEAARVLKDFMHAPLSGNPLKALEAAMARAREFAKEKTLWEKEMDERASGTSTPGRGEMAAGARGTNLKQLEMEKQNAEASRIDERSKMSLAEIAKRPGALDNSQTIQSWWAGEQARNAKQLYDLADQQAANQDFAGAKLTLNRADTMVQSISGVSDNDKQVGAFKTALAGVEQKIDTTNTILTQDE